MDAKEKKKWLLMIWLCLSMAILCSCMGNSSMTVDTVLEINEDFKGSREMSAIVPKSVFKSVFNNDLETLQGLVTEQCPTALLCTATEADDGVKITVTLEFVSLKDYTSKIGLILGKTPGIYYDCSDSIFKNGFAIEENFSSLDLFDWLVQALKEKYPDFSELEAEDIFEVGETTVNYLGKVYVSEAQIHVEDMESNAFERISVELTLNTDESYKAELNFFVDTDTYYSMGDSMDAAIKALVPDGGIYEVETNEGERIYSIAFSALNENALVSQLNRCLKTKNCKISVNEEGDASNPFQAHKEIEIYLDGSYFLDFTKEETELIYKLNVDSSYGFNRCESKTGFLKDSFSTSEGKYTSIYMVVGPSDEVCVYLTYPIVMQKLETTTKIVSENSFEREFRFVFSTEQAKLMGEYFETRLTSRMDESMTLKKTDSQGYKIYSVSFSGTSLNEISQKTSQFLDGTVSEDAETFSSVLQGGKATKKTLKTIAYEYDDTIDFQIFLGSASVENGISYCVEYPKGYEAVLSEGTYDDVREEKNVLKCTTKDRQVHVVSRGEASNIAGLTQLVLWWISLGMSLLMAAVNARHILGYIRHKEKYLLKADLFEGKNLVFMTMGIIAIVVFAWTTCRLLFKIY